MASRKTGASRARSKGQRYIAFLRAINVGSHIVKMDQLRKLFEALPFANVETFIASGNVIFECRAEETQKLERRIEAHLQKSLGYAVATFLRTPDELQAISRTRVFAPDRHTEGSRLYIGFLGSAPSAAQGERVASMSTRDDDLLVVGREVHWLARTSLTESKISYALLEKTLATPATFRNVNTVDRIVAKVTG